MLSRIGKYTVEKELGHGGFGRVYLAFDPDVGQPVAIKRVEKVDPDLLRYFQMEIRTTARLRHKNIVTIYDSGEEDGKPYLVMEFLEGQTLQEVIQERRPLTLLDKVRIMTQVAEGLAYAHSKGVVHRDVKPANIMLLPDGSVKIMDFGIALAPDRNVNMTQTGGLIGTLPYMAPEQIEGYKANEQTDIFAFGDVYYELLTGKHPFEQYMSDWMGLQVADPHPRSAAGERVGARVSGSPGTAGAPHARQGTGIPLPDILELMLDSDAILVDLQHELAAAILDEAQRLVARAMSREPAPRCASLRGSIRGTARRGGSWTRSISRSKRKN